MVVEIYFGVQDPGTSEAARTYPQNYQDKPWLRILAPTESHYVANSLVFKHNSSQVRDVFCKDSVATRVVAVFIAREGLRKSSDILDQSGKNQEN